MKQSNIIITGANGNLGKALLEKSLEKDFRVHAVISPRKEKSFYLHERVDVFQGDLVDREESRRIIDEIIQRDKNVELAVFTVGGFAMGELGNTGPEDFARMMDLNFYPALNMALPLYQHLKREKKSGHLVFIGARSALDMSGATSMAPYALSKSLLFRMAELINRDGKEKGIRASVVVPAIIDTPQNREAMPDADFSKWIQPEKIADTIFQYHLKQEFPGGAGIISLGE